MNKSAGDFGGQSIFKDPACKANTSRFKVINCYPHDCRAYTEGLQIHQGFIYESTGGDDDDPPPSSLRRVDLKTGNVLVNIPVNGKYFAEGLTIFGGKIFQLTEKSGVGLIYDLNDLSRPPEMLSYDGWEIGWGLTNDGENLIVSDGSEMLYFVDPESFKVTGKPLKVHYRNGKPQDSLNELEYIQGYIYANLYPQDQIVRINPQDGTILGKLDLSAIRPQEVKSCNTCELNGIAFDGASGHLFVTGKLWPLLFEIRLKS